MEREEGFGNGNEGKELGGEYRGWGRGEGFEEEKEVEGEDKVGMEAEDEKYLEKKMNKKLEEMMQRCRGKDYIK